MTPYYSDDRVTVFHGRVEDILPSLPDSSVDSIVTDPPYALSFMSAAWDTHASLVAFQAWCEEWATECFRVLKPGGHLVAFGGTRTWHRMVCGIEDAGFEIRDEILAWVYGCLTADVEVLTDTGWRYGVELAEGDLVAQWDPQTGSIDLAPVDRKFLAPWDGPMRVLRNADTDQVLTPNHRVWHRPRRRQMIDGHRVSWYNEPWEVVEAADLSTWNHVQLPVAGRHDGPGIGGADYAALLGWVWTEGGFDPSGTGVRIYQSSVNQAKVDLIAALMDRCGAHKRYDRGRTYRGREYVETTWYISGDLANRVRADLPGKRPTYGLLWRMTAAEKLALLDAALLGGGHHHAKGNWTFFQKFEDDLVWLQTLLALVERSGKVGMRPPGSGREGGSVYLRDRSTTELQTRHLRDSTEHYTGAVWCVGVPTGAFVARRNGKVFITGNSGFPKGHNVSAAIDRLAGVDREVVGRAQGAGSSNTESLGVFASEYDATVPATDEAKQWMGWNTALKPSHEPVCVARKPLAELIDQRPLVESLLREQGVESIQWTENQSGAGTAGSPNRSTSSSSTATAHTIEMAGKRYTITQMSDGSFLWPTGLDRYRTGAPLTVAANVLAYGTGALNIDGCRVGYQSEADRAQTRVPEPEFGVKGDGEGTYNFKAGEGRNGKVFEPAQSGRWPANVVFAHGDGCRQVGTRTVKGAGWSDADRASNTGSVSIGKFKGEYTGTHYADEDGNETVPEWSCVPGCPVAALDEQSGDRPSSGVYQGDGSTRSTGGGATSFAQASDKPRPSIMRDDSGGASRFFPTFEPELPEPGFLYCPKAPRSERPQAVIPVMYRPRVDLTDAERGMIAHLPPGDLLPAEVPVDLAAYYEEVSGGATVLHPT